VSLTTQASLAQARRLFLRIGSRSLVVAAVLVSWGRLFFGRASEGETFKRFLPHAPSSNVPPMAPAEVLAIGGLASASLLITGK